MVSSGERFAFTVSNHEGPARIVVPPASWFDKPTMKRLV